MKQLLGILMVIGLTGCASSTGVLSEGKDSYVVTREGGSGFVKVSGVKADAYHEAEDYCKSKGKEIEVTGTSDHLGGPFVYPMAEVHFMCVNLEDVDFKRPKMAPTSSR